MTRIKTHERGSVAFVTAIVLSGLVGVAGLTALSVRRSLGASGQLRNQAQALLAADSGIAAASAFLRRSYVAGTSWGTFVTANNGTPYVPTATQVLGNNVAPGASGNVLGASGSKYLVTLLNNRSDAGFAGGTDADGVLLIRSEGFGPDGARAVIEVEVQGLQGAAQSAYCSENSQQGQNELGNGWNPCLGTINSADVTTYKPI
jgi:hypothetical protein